MPNVNWPYANSQLSLVEELGSNSLEDGYSLAWFAPIPFTGLKDSWTAEAGVYVFLRGTLAALDQDALADGITRYLLEPKNRRVRFLWLENPGQAFVCWRTHAIAVAGSAEDRRVALLTYIDLRNYSFSIAAGTAIALDDPQDPTGFVLTREAERATGLEWSTGHGAHRMYSLGPEVSLPMQGEQLGTLGFDLRVEFSAQITGSDDVRTFGYPDFEPLDVGMRIFFRDPDFPESGDAYLASYRYPLIWERSQQASAEAFFPATIPFRVTLDPLYPLVAGRCQFAFQALAGAQAATGIPSGYRTNLGYTVHLRPVVGQARLEFALRPALLNDSEAQRAPFYLLPAGSFETLVPIYSQGRAPLPAANFNCGLSGVEYIRVTLAPPSTLTFVPGHPAYAPFHSSVTSLLRDLPSILRPFSSGELPPDTTDLDLPIGAGGLGIRADDRGAIFDLLRQDYFPPGYDLTPDQQEAYEALVRVEQLVDFLCTALRQANLAAAGQAALEPYPTTSWAYIRSPGNAVYFAQPDQAVLYRAEASSELFLDYLEVPSVGLPRTLLDGESEAIRGGQDLEALAFPMLPYGSVAAAALSDIRVLENTAINLVRRARVHAIDEVTFARTSLDAAPPISPASSEGPDTRRGTTPQGLIASFSQDFEAIETIQLARLRDGSSVSLVNIPRASLLKAAFQSNQLFLVISDPAALASHFSTEVLQDFPGLTTVLNLEGWRLQAGTENWGLRGTILVFKFHDLSLMELVATPALWSFPAFFTGDSENAVSNTLLARLRQAVEASESSDARLSRRFEALAEAATQPNWTGILAFDVQVPLSGLPDELAALAGGIDPELFFASYAGVEVTNVAVSGGELTPEASSLFGLIDYNNPIAPTVTQGMDYGFHVPSLSVVFANSRVSDFAAEVQLVAERLFDERTRLLESPTNVVTLVGVAEDQNGRTAYSFGFRGSNRFGLSGDVLEEVEIVRAQFSTDPLPAAQGDVRRVSGRFVFWAQLRFTYLPDFDILAFGPTPGAESGDDQPDFLSVSNLQISLGFDLTTAADGTSSVGPLRFAFDPGQMGFDLQRSGCRSQSLYQQFPLTLRGIRYVRDDPSALAASGFIPVLNPLGEVPLGPTWYGMTFDLNLGTTGALAGNQVLTARLLAAWNPEQEGVYVGVKLPGASGGQREITIQGLLKVVFQAVQFVVYPTDGEPGPQRQVGYLLNLKNIRIQFLNVPFPPTGRTEVTLFGSPGGQPEQERLLGWYAAFVKN